MRQLNLIALLLCLPAAAPCVAQERPTPTADGYRGIWYMNQPQKDQYKFKYSGGFATYPQQMAPLAVYASEVNKTFFVLGGKIGAENRISNLVGWYDHATGEVCRPRVLISRQTNDTHYNPTLAIDEKGHVYVFCNSHGTGYELSKEDPTRGKSYIYRSAQPWSIDSFKQVRDDNFSYSQVWPVPGRGLVWLHTRYDRNSRRIFFATSADGLNWSDPVPMHRIQQGGYQISWAKGGRIATAMDMHPDKGHLNARTNIYFLQTRDFAKTWTTADGKPVDLPLKDAANPALIHDFQKDGLLVYLKDLAFDERENPVILYLTSRGYKSGPDDGPRVWHTARWDGTQWVFRKCFESDHNYDHGSLYIEPGGLWRIIAPTEPGPQPFGTGGQIAVHVSKDQGRTWEKTMTFPVDSGRNQTYVRRPFNASPGFYGYWADGNAFEQSESDLYFCTKEGKVFRLPRKMEGDVSRLRG